MSFRDKDTFGHFDLESTEVLIRSSVNNLGSTILEEILNCDKGGYHGRTIVTENGNCAEFKEYRNKTLQTVLGNVVVKRASRIPRYTMGYP